MSLGGLNTYTVNKYTANSSFDEVAEIIPIANILLGELNAAPLNHYALNESQFYAYLGIQTIFELNQLVGYEVTDTVIELAQNVKVRTAIEGTVISFVQNVKTLLSAFTAMELAQNVIGPTAGLLTRGWDIDITINGVLLPSDRIFGNISITKESNQNTLCEFGLRVADPIGFLEFIDGGTVEINYYNSIVPQRIFTGIVDIPVIDLINKNIKVKCSDRREELIKTKMSHLLPTIGRYSKDVQGDITSVQQEMEYRLSTVPADVDFDSNNNPCINSWYPKAGADYTLDDNDIYYRNPSIAWQSRGNVVNDITVTVKYQYTRLYHYQRPFSWEMPLEYVHLGWNSGVLNQETGEYESGNNPFWFGDNKLSHPTVGMVQSAIEQAGWKDNQSLTYADSYSDVGLDGPVIIAPSGDPFNTLNDTVGTLTSTGTDGNTIEILYAIPPTSVEETRILSADWTASTRFSQNLEEVYTCNVSSTQSITQFGSLTAFANYTTTEDFDAGEWENYTSLTDVPDNAVISGNNYYINKDSAVNTLQTAILTAVDKAKTQIIASHRDTTVSLQIPIKPELELSHTLAIDTVPLSCKGKVKRIVHTIDIVNRKDHTTDIDIALFRAQGSAITTPTTYPARPSDSPVFNTSEVVLGNHMGEDFDNTAGSDTWNGYVGSINYGTQSTLPTKFIVDTPPIPDELRKLRTLNQTATFEQAITSDDLDITF